MNQRLPRAIVRNPRIPLGAGRMAIDLVASFALVSSACVGLAGCVRIYEQEDAFHFAAAPVGSSNPSRRGQTHRGKCAGR